MKELVKRQIQLKARYLDQRSEEPLLSMVAQLFGSHPATNTFAPSDERIIDNYFFVVLDGQEQLIAAASARVDETDAGVLKLLNIIVESQYRGRGIGTWFLRYIEAEAKSILLQNHANHGDLKIRVVPGGSSDDFYASRGYQKHDFLFLKVL